MRRNFWGCPNKSFLRKINFRDQLYKWISRGINFHHFDFCVVFSSTFWNLTTKTKILISNMTKSIQFLQFNLHEYAFCTFHCTFHTQKCLPINYLYNFFLTIFMFVSCFFFVFCHTFSKTWQLWSFYKILIVDR